MKHSTKRPYLCLLAFALLFQNCTQNKASTSAESKDSTSNKGNKKETYYSMADFDKVEKYDTHVHINVVDSTFIKQAQADNFKLITVNVNTSYYPTVAEQQKVALELVKAFPDRLSYATAFSLDDWGTRKWQPQTISYLDNSFKHGAIAVKIWKNIGMALKDKNGKFVFIDDPRFDPILDFIEKSGITLIAHLGEPKNAWLPMDSMTVAGDKHYFTEHPEYHMYKHPKDPSYMDEINARDNMLKKHPHLKVVGAHLGSLEWNVDELAKRLDQFPNFAVDLAARTVHLQYQSIKNPDKVRDFIIKYQDRLVYGTDDGVTAKSNLTEMNKSLHKGRLRDWQYFTSADTLSTDDFPEKFRGLHLPKEVVNKIYHDNAKTWFPKLK
jgi:predicted TIM-barrel fold metal-dependent hydrolase